MDQQCNTRLSAKLSNKIEPPSNEGLHPDLFLRIRQSNHLLNWNFQPRGCPFQVPAELAAVRGIQGILGKFPREGPGGLVENVSSVSPA